MKSLTPDPQAELRKELSKLQLFSFNNQTVGLSHDNIDEIMQLFNNLIAEIESKLPGEHLQGETTPKAIAYDSGRNQAIKEVKAILATYKGKESEK